MRIRQSILYGFLMIICAAPVVAQSYVQLSPSSSQTVTQPSGTTLTVNNLTVPYYLGIGPTSLRSSSSGLSLGYVTPQQDDPYWMTLNIGTVLLHPESNEYLPASISNINGGILLKAFDGGPIWIDSSNSQGEILNTITNSGEFLIWDKIGNTQETVFCVNAQQNDFVGVGGPDACSARDIFDISNRETFGDGYMHWWAHNASVAWDTSYQYIASGWNAGISNPANGVLTFDTTTDGNGAATIKAGKLQFPDGTFFTSAASSSSSGNFTGSVGVGTTSPGAWSGVSGLGGSNLQLFGSGTNARLVVNSTLNDAAEIHLVDGAAAAGHRNHRFYADSSGLVLDQPTDNYASTTANMFWGNDGKVGIGTNTPASQLEVHGNVTLSGTGAGIYFPGNNTPQTTPWTGTLDGGDYAESVDVPEGRQNLEPGDVLTVDVSGPGKFNRTAEPYSTLVAGVYATKPGLIGRRTTDPQIVAAQVPMAVLGIVPTKVCDENGPIRPGDILVTSSTTGYAMRGSDRSRLVGAIVGKALGELKAGKGKIEVLISLQ